MADVIGGRLSTWPIFKKGTITVRISLRVFKHRLNNLDVSYNTLLANIVRDPKYINILCESNVGASIRHYNCKY